MSVEERLKEIIGRQAGIDPKGIKPSDRLREDLHLDSLDAVELALAIEDEFGARLEVRFFTFGELARYLEEVEKDGGTPKRT